MQYSTFLQDLQGDSEDEEKNTEKMLKYQARRTLPISKSSKLILTSLEKEKLLLSLTPLAFNDNLEGEAQTFSLFVE